MLKTISSYLLFTRYSKLKFEFKDNFESHPNFPSLFALTDTFTLLGIENVAAKIPKEKLEELPISFLAYVENGQKGADLALVFQINNKIEITFDEQKKQILTIEEFRNKWNGIVVVIEPNENKESKSNSSLQKTIMIAFGLIVLFFIKQGFQFSLIATLNYLLYTLGFIVSVFIIQEKLDKGQESVSKLCTFNENTSCDSVIKSSGAKINKWLDFSDLPILFFSIAILVTLFDTKLNVLINSLSLLSIPIVIYSFWLQKVKLRKWCVLCLAVSTILVLQSTLLFFLEVKIENRITNLIIAIIIAPTVWFLFKNYLEKNNDLEKNNKELKRFKRNYKVFELLQNPLKLPISSAQFSTIEIGSRWNAVRISLALSPSCSHCHTAFEQALNTYNTNREKVFLSFFFNLNIENNDNPYLNIAKNVMQIYKINPEQVIEALSDWHIKKMSIVDWLFKWEQFQIDDDVIENLQLQYEWCLQNEFNYTPVKMINESEYPKEYDLNELKYFISEIEEKHNQ